MANANETSADIVAEMETGRPGLMNAPINANNSYYARRLKAALKRERAKAGRGAAGTEKTTCYSDLDEFWVVGDFVARAFMGWGGECHQCYVDFEDPTRAERFSTCREALKYMKSDEDAAAWVEQHGGSRFAKPLRCRKSVVVYPPGVRP